VERIFCYEEDFKLSDGRQPLKNDDATVEYILRNRQSFIYSNTDRPPDTKTPRHFVELVKVGGALIRLRL
jgi:hypothetical protein